MQVLGVVAHKAEVAGIAWPGAVVSSQRERAKLRTAVRDDGTRKCEPCFRPLARRERPLCAEGITSWRSRTLASLYRQDRPALGLCRAAQLAVGVHGAGEANGPEQGQVGAVDAVAVGAVQVDPVLLRVATEAIPAPGLEQLAGSDAVAQLVRPKPNRPNKNFGSVNRCQH